MMTKLRGGNIYKRTNQWQIFDSGFWLPSLESSLLLVTMKQLSFAKNKKNGF